jgi:hypothetical protein
VNPDVDWSRYDCLILDSLQFWRSTDKAHVSQEECESIGSACYDVVAKEYAKDWKLVQSPGPNVIRIRFAFTELKGANVPVQVITGVIPQARAVTMLGGLAADQGEFVAQASAEAELVDSVTGRRLAAAVAERWGTKSLTTMFSTWADVVKACEFWAQRGSRRLANVKAGRRPVAD